MKIKKSRQHKRPVALAPECKSHFVVFTLTLLTAGGSIFVNYHYETEWSLWQSQHQVCMIFLDIYALTEDCVPVELDGDDEIVNDKMLLSSFECEWVWMMKNYAFAHKGNHWQ